MSKDLYFIKYGGHSMNVGDISTVSPHIEAMFTDNQREGVKITFMSKATSIFIPDVTPDDFMDAITEAVNLALPD